MIVAGKCRGCDARLDYTLRTEDGGAPEISPPFGGIAYADGHLCRPCDVAVARALDARRRSGAFDRLVAEYEAWCTSEGLKLGSADEHADDERLTAPQRAWLAAYVERWEAMARSNGEACSAPGRALKRYVIEYARIPTSRNPSQRAVVLAEDEDKARELIAERLGDRGLALPNYSIERIALEQPIASAGSVVSSGVRS